MKITCYNEEQLYKAIKFLTENGLGFHADADTLTIELTGAH